MAARLYSERLEKLIIHGAVFNFEAYPTSQREGLLNITWDANSESANDPSGFPGMAIEHYLLGKEDLSDFEVHLQEMAKMWATSPNLNKEDLNNINVPNLVIVGDHFNISIPHTVGMHEALGNSVLFVAPGATHFIHQEKPELLHRVIHDFLKAS
jgi:pimeloyl-ACP methyl ester carboxylesterase